MIRALILMIFLTFICVQNSYATLFIIKNNTNSCTLGVDGVFPKKSNSRTSQESVATISPGQSKELSTYDRPLVKYTTVQISPVKGDCNGVQTKLIKSKDIHMNAKYTIDQYIKPEKTSNNKKKRGKRGGFKLNF